MTSPLLLPHLPSQTPFFKSWSHVCCRCCLSAAATARLRSQPCRPVSCVVASQPRHAQRLPAPWLLRCMCQLAHQRLDHIHRQQCRRWPLPHLLLQYHPLQASAHVARLQHPGSSPEPLHRHRLPRLPVEHLAGSVLAITPAPGPTSSQTTSWPGGSLSLSCSGPQTSSQSRRHGTWSGGECPCIRPCGLPTPGVQPTSNLRFQWHTPLRLCTADFLFAYPTVHDCRLLELRTHKNTSPCLLPYL